MQIAYLGNDFLFLGIYFFDSCKPEIKIRVFLNYLSNRIGNRSGFQASCGNLIQQRLKSMVIVFVQQNHLNVFILEFFGQS